MHWIIHYFVFGFLFLNLNFTLFFSYFHNYRWQNSELQPLLDGWRQRRNQYKLTDTVIALKAPAHQSVTLWNSGRSSANVCDASHVNTSWILLAACHMINACLVAGRVEKNNQGLTVQLKVNHCTRRETDIVKVNICLKTDLQLHISSMEN